MNTCRVILVTFFLIVLPMVGYGATPNHNMVIDQTSAGYKMSFTVKYTFFDQVTYESEYNGSGSGEIMSIDIDSDGVVRYTIREADDTWQSGILEEEITLRKGKE